MVGIRTPLGTWWKHKGPDLILLQKPRSLCFFMSFLIYDKVWELLFTGIVLKWFSKYDSCTKSLSITKEPVRNADFWALAQTQWVTDSEMRPSYLKYGSGKESMHFWHTQQGVQECKRARQDCLFPHRVDTNGQSNTWNQLLVSSWFLLIQP